MTDEPLSKGHTVGPWIYEAGDSVVHIVGLEREPIAVTDRKRYYQRHDETDIANARLIAAAPDYAAVAPRALDMLERYEAYIKTVNASELTTHPYLPELQEIIADLRAAISRARGES